MLPFNEAIALWVVRCGHAAVDAQELAQLCPDTGCELAASVRDYGSGDAVP